MEASGLPPREADVAPDVDPTSTGHWVPADAGPLGLAAFATTTFVLSVVNANLVGGQYVDTVLPLALAFGGICQLLAGMWEFRSGNTFGATAFTAYGAFWIGVYIFLHTSVPGIIAGAAKGTTPNIGSALGLYLWAWTIFTAYMLVAALRTNVALVLTFVILFITFILLSIGNSGGSSSTVHLGGWLGIITAALAWYTSAAGVTNASWGRTVLPVFPLSG
ncbi:MAG: acetate uptake transporter [Solirubrobacteraceae bacterium]|jgi:succinate-acetate transporter protein